MQRALIAFVLAGLVELSPAKAETSLTIYNEDFAIIRDSLKLDLKAGVNDVRYSNVALFVEPSSVILRDPSGKAKLDIQEQAFRGGAVTQDTMLSQYEGQTIDFVRFEQGHSQIIQGKVIRSGRGKFASDATRESERVPTLAPIIEVDGKIQFELPGTPR